MTQRDIPTLRKALKKDPALPLSLSEAWQIYIEQRIEFAMSEHIKKYHKTTKKKV